MGIFIRETLSISHRLRDIDIVPSSILGSFLSFWVSHFHHLGVLSKDHFLKLFKDRSFSKIVLFHFFGQNSFIT